MGKKLTPQRNRRYKKNQKEILELKNIKTDIEKLKQSQKVREKGKIQGSTRQNDRNF